MSSLQRAIQLIEMEYNRLWDSWYATTGVSTRAKLTISLAEADSGYRRNKDEIVLNIPEGNLMDVIASDGSLRCEGYGGWLLWYVELVHEMIHEYQAKVVSGSVSDAGAKLRARCKRIPVGPGHDETFYTAVCLVAPYLELSAEQLVERL